MIRQKYPRADRVKINSSGMLYCLLCWNTKFAISFCQEQVSSSKSTEFIPRFAIVLLCFDHSLDFKIPQDHLVVSLIELPFFSNTLGDLECNTPVPTAMTVFLEIAQSAIPRLCQFLGDYTRMSRTFKSDFLSRCSFFVYILSPIQIAPIVNCFPFEFITLVAVRGPFMSCCYPMFVDVKPNLLFHILRNALLLFLCLFLFH